jgi:hypothetical protein
MLLQVKQVHRYLGSNSVHKECRFDLLFPLASRMDRAKRDMYVRHTQFCRADRFFWKQDTRPIDHYQIPSVWHVAADY